MNTRASYTGLADGLNTEYKDKVKRQSEAWHFRSGTTLYEDVKDLKSAEVRKVLKFLKDPETRAGTYRVSAILRA